MTHNVLILDSSVVTVSFIILCCNKDAFIRSNDSQLCWISFSFWQSVTDTLSPETHQDSCRVITFTCWEYITHNVSKSKTFRNSRESFYGERVGWGCRPWPIYAKTTHRKWSLNDQDKTDLQNSIFKVRKEHLVNVCGIIRLQLFT